MRITKNEALKVYNNPKTKVLFDLHFPKFKDYWRECEKLNQLSEDQFKEEETKAEKKLKKISKKLKEIKSK